jgi:hypothetical protein
MNVSMSISICLGVTSGIHRFRESSYLLSELRKMVWFIVCNGTFNNISVISWRPVVVVEKAGVPGENRRPVANYCRLQLKGQFVRNTHTDIHGKKVQI